MNSLVLQSFATEMEKTALAASVARQLLGSPLRGAMAGAALGATHGAATAEEGNRLQGALGGAVRGGALGGAAGFVGRKALDYRITNPGSGAWQTIKGTAGGVGESVKHFGKRQIHGLTGAYKNDPGGMGLESLATAEKEKALAVLRRDDALRRVGRKDFSLKRTGPRDDFAKATAEHRKFRNAVDKYQSRGEQGQRELQQGITSVPGTLKGLWSDPKATGKALWNRATGSNVLGTALGVGLPVLTAAPGLMRGDESAEGGPTMKRKLLMLGGNVGGGVLTSGLPVIPQMAAMSGIDAALAHRRRAPRGPVVQDVHSMEAPSASPGTQGRTDVR